MNSAQVKIKTGLVFLTVFKATLQYCHHQISSEAKVRKNNEYLKVNKCMSPVSPVFYTVVTVSICLKTKSRVRSSIS